MAILTGPEIRRQMALGAIKIDPAPQNIGPNSADLTLGPVLKRYRKVGADGRRAPGWIWDPFEGWVMDAKSPPELEDVPQTHGGWLLHPGCLYLGSTAEYTETHGFVPLLEGRSSLGRLGVFAHVTAGIGDDGFKGCWTSELVVVAPIVIYPGGRYFQCVYHTIEGDRQPYQGRYQGDREPVGSRILDPEPKRWATLSAGPSDGSITPGLVLYDAPVPRPISDYAPTISPSTERPTSLRHCDSEPCAMRRKNSASHICFCGCADCVALRPIKEPEW